MLSKSIKALVAASSIALATGCASTVSPVGTGLITIVDGPIMATPSMANTKTGTSCANNILGLVASGNASIEKAKENGGISEVSSVDHSSTSILFLYSRFCTVVTGR